MVVGERERGIDLVGPRPNLHRDVELVERPSSLTAMSFPVAGVWRSCKIVDEWAVDSANHAATVVAIS